MNPGSTAYYNSIPNAALVAILGGPSQIRSFDAQIQQVVNRTLSLRTQEHVSPGTALRISVDGGLVLGSVSRCLSDGPGYTWIVEIDEVIPDAAGLGKLVSAVMGFGPPSADPVNRAEWPSDDAVVAPAVMRPRSS